MVFPVLDEVVFIVQRNFDYSRTSHHDCQMIRKVKIFISLIFVTVNLACSNRPVNSDPEARKMVIDFYQWYINDAYKNKFDYYQVPPFKKVGAKSYVFDKEELARRLNSVRYFSSAFKNRLLNKVEGCNQQMLKRNWDYEPEPQFNIEGNHFWFDNWIGGQGEDIDGFSVISETIKNNETEFLVEILINKKKFTNANVTVVKEGDVCKINGIQLIWN